MPVNCHKIFTSERSHLQLSTSCISITVCYQYNHCLCEALLAIHTVCLWHICFWTMFIDLGCGKHKKILCTCVIILTKHRKSNVCSGYRVTMCKVLYLHIKRTAAQVLGAILRLKRTRQIGSAILLSSHMLSSEYATI